MKIDSSDVFYSEEIESINLDSVSEDSTFLAQTPFSFVLCKFDFLTLTNNTVSLIGSLYSFKEKKSIKIKAKISTSESIALISDWKNIKELKMSYSYNDNITSVPGSFHLKSLKFCDFDPEKNLCFLKLNIISI